MTTPQPPYTCAPDVLFQEVNGEIVLLDLDSESYFGLNATGARIWQLMQEGKSGEALLEQMLEEFEIEREQLQADVSELIDQLCEAGLIVRSEAA